MLTDASFLRRAVALIIDAVLLAVAYVVIGMLIWFTAPGLFIFPIEITELKVLDEEITEQVRTTTRIRTADITYFGSTEELATCRFLIVLVTEETGGYTNTKSWTKELLEPCPYLERLNLGVYLRILLLLFYAPLMEASGRQATVGKMAVGLRVRTLQGRPISFGRAFLRNLAELLCLLTLTGGYLMALFTRRRQALHDFLTGTVVTEK